jgi:hypothetical protein
MPDEAVGLQHPSLQPFPNQAQKGAVIDALAQHGQEPRGVQLVEEAFDIGLHQGAIRSVLQVEGEVTDRTQRPPSTARAVATIQQVLFIDCRQQLRAGPLHQFVFACGNP